MSARIVTKDWSSHMFSLCCVFLSDQTVILNGPQDVRVLRGSSALLDCVFQKDPRLIKYQIVWKKAEHKMQESSPDDK